MVNSIYPTKISFDKKMSSRHTIKIADSIFASKGEENRLQDWSFCDEKVLLSVAPLSAMGADWKLTGSGAVD